MSFNTALTDEEKALQKRYAELRKKVTQRSL